MPGQETYALVFVDDVDLITDWAVAQLGMTENWRAPGDSGVTEHSEVLWGKSRVSINIKRANNEAFSLSSVAVSVNSDAEVDRIYQHMRGNDVAAPEPATSTVAYGFTVQDPLGNEWWVHNETGFLDQFRQIK